MIFTIPTNNIPCTFIIQVETTEPCEIIINALNPRKESTYYMNRKVEVDGKRTFHIKLPISPKVLVINIYNGKNGNAQNDEDKTFKITKFESKPSKKNSLWTSAKDRSFIKLAKQFSENASILSAGDRKPSIYRSDDTRFEIDYFDKIRDKKTGKPVSTPARIGHKSGIIEVSKSDFIKMTVPMRMVILLHEYSHKYKNPEINRDIRDETGADINGLSLYLSLGFSEIEAIRAYLTVFKGANNEANDKRYMFINDFIKKFNAGKLGNNVTDYKVKN